MTNVRPPAEDHGQVALGAGNMRDEPVTIWSQRTDMDIPQEQLNKINSTPFMCMQDGKLKVDTDAIELFNKDTPERDFIDKFCSSLARKNVPTTSYSRCTKNDSEPATKIGSLLVKRSDFDGSASSHGCKLAKRTRTDVERDEEEPKTPDNKRNKSTSKTPHSDERYLKRLNVLKVPHGVCGGDRMAIFDNVNMPSIFIDVPVNAYDDMRLEYERPSSPVKLLLVDGKNGYKVGGSTLKQHTTRLSVHRRLCANDSCTVLGCKEKTNAPIFQNGDEKSVNDYYEHWSYSCRNAMRSHGLKLRVMASGV